MSKAETAFEDSERRLEEFVEESQAKMDAARNAKLKYKRRLSERNNEIGILLEENSNLHQQIGDHSQELTALGKGKQKMAIELEEKDAYIKELTSSGDKRMRSMNSAYNELRSKYETQSKEQDTGRLSRLEAELSARDATIGALRAERGGNAASFSALEQEVRSLKDDKQTFERLVASLQEKIRHLETLQEWDKPADLGGHSTPSRTPARMMSPDLMLSSSQSHHSATRRPISLLSQPTSIQQERPTTQASTQSKQEESDAWAMEVERMRLQRDEVAVQLKDNGRARNDLRRSLKQRQSQLDVLEKQNKSQRRPNVLRKKSRPFTPLRPSTGMGHYEQHQAPATPSRPRTMGDMRGESHTPKSRHTIHFSPSTQFSPETFDSVERPSTSTPLSSHRKRWSGIRRPGSSFGFRPSSRGTPHSDVVEQPTTSAEERTREHEHCEKRRWSAGLRKLFKGKV